MRSLLWETDDQVDRYRVERDRRGENGLKFAEGFVPSCLDELTRFAVIKIEAKPSCELFYVERVSDGGVGLMGSLMIPVVVH